MNPLASWLPPSTWFALAAVLTLVPAADGTSERVRLLRARGRLAAGHGSPRRKWGVVQLTGIPALAVGLIVGVGVLGGAGPPLGLAAAVVAATGWRLTVQAICRRREHTADVALLSAVRVVEAELAAGSRPSAALGAAAAAAPLHAAAFAEAAARAGVGTDADEPLRATPGLRPLGHAWRIGTTVGAPLADVVGRVADDLAARAQQARTVSTALAAARSSAALLAVLPVLGVALGSGMDADPLAFLFGSAAGRWVLLAGICLDAAGLLWTQRLTERAERL